MKTNETRIDKNSALSTIRDTCNQATETVAAPTTLTFEELETVIAPDAAIRKGYNL